MYSNGHPYFRIILLHARRRMAASVRHNMFQLRWLRVHCSPMRRIISSFLILSFSFLLFIIFVRRILGWSGTLGNIIFTFTVFMCLYVLSAFRQSEDERSEEKKNNFHSIARLSLYSRNSTFFLSLSRTHTVRRIAVSHHHSFGSFSIVCAFFSTFLFICGSFRFAWIGI